MIQEFLNYYTISILVIVIPSICWKFFPILKLLLKHRKHSGISNSALDYPKPKPFRFSLRKTLCNPLEKFHMKSNRSWAIGYCLYHTGIVLLVMGYLLSAVILLFKYFGNAPIPDISVGVQSMNSLSPANLLAIIFGNGESLQARFLFGEFATLFQTITWVEIACAFVGNQLLLWTVFLKRSGAVKNSIDPAVATVRIDGKRSLQHLVVRLIILFCIISEIVGRLHLMEDIVYYHAVAALTLILFFLFTYLSHIAYAPLSLYFAFKKRRHNVFA